MPDWAYPGVNFGVVETGTLMLVTNEGNGRMCTTLPPVHVALMGMERLVPTLDDLALMLYLLPRSATGQKLSVYTSLIHGPRRPGELDGPEERHLVLVDNGRDALRQSPLAEALYCIRCGACLNACPVFREIGGHAYAGATGASPLTPGRSARLSRLVCLAWQSSATWRVPPACAAPAKKPARWISTCPSCCCGCVPRAQIRRRTK